MNANQAAQQAAQKAGPSSLQQATSGKTPLVSVHIQQDADAVLARQRARVIAEQCRMDTQSQTRFATAVSELARNIHQYAGKGRIHFSIDLESIPQAVLAEFVDEGPGIPHLNDVMDGLYRSASGMGVGLLGAKRLMDDFQIESTPREGTRILIRKNLPASLRMRSEGVAKLANELAARQPVGASEEVLQQNRELLLTLESMATQGEELAQLNRELAETNSGVLALYAELDEKASSLQKANQVKTNFLSHMTHEFRTPLTSIISIAKVLLDRLDGDLSIEQERQVRFINDSASGLLELVNDLLDLAKVEAGRVAIRATELQVHQLLGALRGVFKPIVAQNPDVALMIEESALDLTLISDEGKVSQILRNLVSNAIKFTERGHVSVSARSEESEIVFEVEDTGIGISQENIALIFEEFVQVDGSNRKAVRGTGLGLPLSLKLARLLGGGISVVSEPGRGSTFSLRLPLVYQGRDEGVLITHDSEQVAGGRMGRS